MRRLAQPEVARSAALAALASAVLCAPRFALWVGRSYPIWYLEAITYCGSFVLWAFVFAWHTPYTQRPVFQFRVRPRAWGLATAAALFMAFVLHRFLDGPLRQTTPADYPPSFAQWLGMALFNLALVQLFLVFAPLAWLLRLFRNQTVAVALTVLFGLVVLLLKTRLSPAPFPTGLLAALVGVRVVLALLAVGFYLRGGILLASWFALLVHARHLLHLL
jgi:hypothetical protein